MSAVLRTCINTKGPVSPLVTATPKVPSTFPVLGTPCAQVPRKRVLGNQLDPLPRRASLTPQVYALNEAIYQSVQGG